MTEHVKINRRQFLQVGAAAVGGGMLLLNSSAVEAGADGPGRSGSSHIFDEQEGPMELTLKRSLDLAGQNLLGMLNPEDNYLPYWTLMVLQDYKAQMNVVWPAHNIGRWWDAMLRLEDAVGFRIPKKTEAAMLANTHRFFDNPDHICISPDPKAKWDLHSLREGLLALNALARWRKNDWAASQGQKMILSIDEKLRDDGTWDLAKFDATQKDRQNSYPPSACESHGRMLEALVWFYETTGDLEALRLGDRIARWHFENTTQPDGGINKSAKADHMHSYLGTLRGLLLWGQMTRQHEYLARVADTYRTTVRSLVHESGYTSHNLKESFPETSSPGDAAQIALWLSRAGYGEFLDDAERLVRARLLPSQIVTSPPLRPTVDDGKDAHRDLDKRVIGGYGGCHTKPHGGKQGITDVTAAGVHTLVDIYKRVAVLEEGRLEVLFHLDYEDRRVSVVSRRDKGAELVVTPKAKSTVDIRVPKWTSQGSVIVKVGDKVVKPVLAGGFARLGPVPAGSRITMHYELPERVTWETDLGEEFEVFWRGDDVVGIRPNTDFYPFYPDAPVGAK